VSPTMRCGVDVEVTEVARAKGISSKFLSSEEAAWAATQTDLIYPLLWSLKESAYKWYGRKQVIFAAQMHIDPFMPHEVGSALLHFCLPQNEWIDLQINYRFTADFLVSWCLAPATLLN